MYYSSEAFLNNLLRRVAYRFILTLLFILPIPGIAVDTSLVVDDTKLKERVDSVLALMSFSVLPDVTTSSLSINDASNDKIHFSQSTLGGGFTWSQDFPLYLEGTIGYSRYDPKFVATEGNETFSIPVKWNNFTISGGIGWDFPLTKNNELKLRPIFNFLLGHVESDASLLGRYLENELDMDSDTLSFLHSGRLNAYGLGGSIMLDWEHYREAYEVDVELRYAYMNFTNFDMEYSSLKGSAEANIISLWTRWRAPTGMTILKNPLRYVLEASNTTFLKEEDDAIGFNYLTTIGGGFEIDSSAYTHFITRVRLLYRYTFGENISGYTIGFAVSF